MSHRSQVANSGSRPIEACSAACAAPGTSAGGEPGAARARLGRPSTRPPGCAAGAAAGRAAPRRGPRRSRPAGAGRRRPGWSPRPCRRTASRRAQDARLRGLERRRMSVMSRAYVVQSGSARVDQRDVRRSRSSESTRGRSRPGAGRPRRRATVACAAPRVDRAEQPAGARPRPARPAGRPSPRMSARSAGPLAPGPVPARRRGGAAARGSTRCVGDARAASGPNSARSSSVSGSSAAAAHRCGREHVRVVGVEHGRLDRPAEQRLRVVDEVGVERVVAGDEHGERALPGPPGPAGLLPQRGPGAGPAGEQHGVQAGDVDARARARWSTATPEQPPRLQVGLQRAPLLGQVAAAVGRDPRRRARGRPRRAAAGWSARPSRRRAATARRPASATPSTTRSASRSAASAVAVRRTGAPCSPASSVSGGSHSANSSSPRAATRRRSTATTGRPVSRPADAAGSDDRRRGEHERPASRAVARAHPPQPAQHRRRRASRRRRGSGGTRRRRRTAGRAGTAAQRGCPGRIERCSMSGLVSTYDACWRTQSRASTGVSPSYVAARSRVDARAPRSARSWSAASALVGER